MNTFRPALAFGAIGSLFNYLCNTDLIGQEMCRTFTSNTERRKVTPSARYYSRTFKFPEAELWAELLYVKSFYDFQRVMCIDEKLSYRFKVTSQK
ncbi:hypothetical protein BpHYR1_001506 [Brachionus plicatilis]|uniref:Uncharacterized protein n=1 Tax=Brachionus plicatilis TaxID=10195 RepID=A0A3M7PCL6_BRAPC|nr:hypothetical protein BpHYR1_001506 [Brachionus plicatilis]